MTSPSPTATPPPHPQKIARNHELAASHGGLGAWRTPIIVVYLLMGIGLIYVLFMSVNQHRINRLVARVGAEGEEWRRAEKELVDSGREALPYLAKVFYYHDDAKVRRRVGMIMLAILRKIAPESPDSLWQAEIREDAESEMISKALRDEDPTVRALASQMVKLIGHENEIEATRFRHWQRTEELLEVLRKGDAEAVKQAEAELARIGDFPLPILLGVAMDQNEPPQARDAARRVMYEVLTAKYRADEREELATILGRRRVRMLFELLAQDAPLVEKILALSPRVSEEFIAEAKRSLQQASPQERLKLIEKYSAQHARIEEGR